jgi:hypothetical protein
LQGFAAAVEASAVASFLRQSHWTYPAVNAAHLLGVALLVGAVVPMDLRLIGVWRPDVRLDAVLALLRSVAAFGAALAVLTGLLLFSVQARDYVTMRLFAVKLTLVTIGLAHALAWGGALGRATPARQRAAGALSIVLWVSVLVCGRMLGYL